MHINPQHRLTDLEKGTALFLGADIVFFSHHLSDGTCVVFRNAELCPDYNVVNIYGGRMYIRPDRLQTWEERQEHELKKKPYVEQPLRPRRTAASRE